MATVNMVKPRPVMIRLSPDAFQALNFIQTLKQETAVRSVSMNSIVNDVLIQAKARLDHEQVTASKGTVNDPDINFVDAT